MSTSQLIGMVLREPVKSAVFVPFSRRMGMWIQILVKTGVAPLAIDWIPISTHAQGPTKRVDVSKKLLVRDAFDAAAIVIQTAAWVAYVLGAELSRLLSIVHLLLHSPA